jgi:hypothetical protein
VAGETTHKPRHAKLFLFLFLFIAGYTVPSRSDEDEDEEHRFQQNARPPLAK